MRLMKSNKLPEMHYLNEALEYDDTAPSCLRWKNRPRHHFPTSRGHLIFRSRSSGKPAGSKTCSGDGIEHFRIKINQVVYPAHRIVFALVNGFDPAGKEVDHIDGNALNNKDSNLRIATRQENARNKNRPVNNASGKKGVTWCKRTSRWMAQIGHNKKTVFLGRFERFQDAVNARTEADDRIHGRFAKVTSPTRSPS